MFETPEFEKKLVDEVRRVAASNGLAYYQRVVPRTLITLARQNEQELLSEELTKSASIRRGVPDAIQSVTKVASAAARIAKDAGRNTLTKEDFDRAYAANFCRIWPFCK